MIVINRTMCRIQLSVATLRPSYFHTAICALVLLVVSACGCSEASSTSSVREHIDAGWHSYRMGEFSIAIRHFESVVSDPAASQDERIEALYGLATTWNLRRPGQDAVKAKSLYQQVIELDPTGDLAAWSLLAMARMEHLAPVGQEADYDLVYGLYQNVIDRFPAHIAGQEALIHQQAMRISRFQIDDAPNVVQRLSKFIEDYPDSLFLSTAHDLLAECYRTLNRPDERLQSMILSLQTQVVDPNNPFFENAGRYWSIAGVAEFEVGDVETASHYYQLLIDEYPVDARVFPSRQGLERITRIVSGEQHR